jgi:hypothetical protein
MASHHRTNDGHYGPNLYIREENCASSRTSSHLNPNFLLFRTDCRWRLPLWLLLFGVMVSALTLSYLLTGTVYPNSWTRFSSESLDMLSASEGFYRAGHQPPTIGDAASSMVEPVSHATPDRVFAQISRSGDVTMAPSGIGCPSSSGLTTLVDDTVRRDYVVV